MREQLDKMMVLVKMKSSKAKKSVAVTKWVNYMAAKTGYNHRYL